MQFKINYKILSSILIFFSFSSLFLGFYLDENSAGAGSYNGDIQTIWNNLQIFISNDIITAINHEDYFDSRTPIAYILYKILNPFTDNILDYRRSVFAISLTLPILFYFCLKLKFVNVSGLLLFLIASTVCLSPYFRTSSYWGLEENLGLIFLLLTFLSLNSFLKDDNKTESKVHFYLFLTTFLSSCCLYFDQKLVIIPIICLIKIFLSNRMLNLKLFSIFYYFLFSLPYIYFISIWNGLIPTTALEGRKLGNEIFFDHIGFAVTIIAFYLFPLLLFKNKNIKDLIRINLFNRRNYFLLSLFIIYIFYLVLFFNLNEQSAVGKGFVNKISLIFFDDNFTKNIFIYFSFLVSWVVILVYIENKFEDILTLIFLLILSIFLWPIHQEYFDPLILIMAFTFFNSKLIINYKNSIILFLYLSLLLVASNIYYIKLLN